MSFKCSFPLIKVSQKVNKQHCKILTFEYPNMSQYNYPKIKPRKSMYFSIMENPTHLLIQESVIYYFRLSRPFFNHHNPPI